MNPTSPVVGSNTARCPLTDAPVVAYFKDERADLFGHDGCVSHSFPRTNNPPDQDLAIQCNSFSTLWTKQTMPEEDEQP